MAIMYLKCLWMVAKPFFADVFNTQGKAMFGNTNRTQIIAT